MSLYAEATCVLEVNDNCHACKMKTVEIFGSTCGPYNVDIDNEEGLARFQGVVEPNLFMKALAGTGSHAKPKFVKLQHPKMNFPYRNGYNFRPGLNPFSHRLPLPQYPFRPMEPSYPPQYRGSNPYYHGSNPHYFGSGLPPPRRRGPFHF